MGYDGRLRLRNVVKWDVGRPAPRPPRRLAAMRSLTVCRCRGRRPRRPAEVSGGGRYAGGMNFSPYGLPVSGSWPEGCGGVKTPPYDAKDKGWQWRGSVNGLRTRGSREGGSPPLCSWRAVARERVVMQGPSGSFRPRKLGQLFGPGPLCRSATSPRAAGSHP